MILRRNHGDTYIYYLLKLNSINAKAQSRKVSQRIAAPSSHQTELERQSMATIFSRSSL